MNQDSVREEVSGKILPARQGGVGVEGIPQGETGVGVEGSPQTEANYQH